MLRKIVAVLIVFACGLVTPAAADSSTWRFGGEVDPLTDKPSYAILSQRPGFLEGRLSVACFNSRNGPVLTVGLGEVLRSQFQEVADVEVAYRFDHGPVIRDTWLGAQDGVFTFEPPQIKKFVEGAKSARERIVLSYDNETLVFTTAGFAESYQQMMDKKLCSEPK